jgi:dTDP-4-amino-4,6-dideoxy-D-galactose acyltransferase
MRLEQLLWDSEFFAKKVYRLCPSDEEPLEGLALKLANVDYDVIYVVYPYEWHSRFAPVLECMGAIHVDNRVTYQKAIKSASFPHEVIRLKVISAEARGLAYVSGHFSRFNIDTGFHADFKRLYDRWLENAFKSESGVVLGSRCESGRLVGMVTADIFEGRIGRIGLIATDKGCRGQGVGSKLLQACEAFYSDNQISLGEVITQGQNIEACRFYEKNGYGVCSRMSVWHLWRTKE